jgi:hypothetical protein
VLDFGIMGRNYDEPRISHYSDTERHPSVSVTDLATTLDRLAERIALSSSVLVVHVEPETATAAVRELARKHGWIALSVGLASSIELLNVPIKQRSRHIRQWLRNQVNSTAPTPVALTGIDILFEPSLAIDPLALLRQMARLTPVIAAWPGTFDGQTLAYAIPEHAHYRTWRDLGTDVTPVQL